MRCSFTVCMVINGNCQRAILLNSSTHIYIMHTHMHACTPHTHIHTLTFTHTHTHTKTHTLTLTHLEKERERDRDRQTDRQAGQQTDWQTEMPKMLIFTLCLHVHLPQVNCQCWRCCPPCCLCLLQLYFQLATPVFLLLPVIGFAACKFRAHMAACHHFPNAQWVSSWH